MEIEKDEKTVKVGNRTYVLKDGLRVVDPSIHMDVIINQDDLHYLTEHKAIPVQYASKVKICVPVGETKKEELIGERRVIAPSCFKSDKLVRDCYTTEGKEFLEAKLQDASLFPPMKRYADLPLSSYRRIVVTCWPNTTSIFGNSRPSQVSIHNDYYNWPNSGSYDSDVLNGNAKLIKFKDGESTPNILFNDLVGTWYFDWRRTEYEFPFYYYDEKDYSHYLSCLHILDIQVDKDGGFTVSYLLGGFPLCENLTLLLKAESTAKVALKNLTRYYLYKAYQMFWEENPDIEHKTFVDLSNVKGSKFRDIFSKVKDSNENTSNEQKKEEETIEAENLEKFTEECEEKGFAQLCAEKGFRSACETIQSKSSKDSKSVKSYAPAMYSKAKDPKTLVTKEDLTEALRTLSEYGKSHLENMYKQINASISQIKESLEKKAADSKEINLKPSRNTSVTDIREAITKMIENRENEQKRLEWVFDHLEDLSDDKK